MVYSNLGRYVTRLAVILSLIGVTVQHIGPLVPSSESKHHINVQNTTGKQGYGSTPSSTTHSNIRTGNELTELKPEIDVQDIIERKMRLLKLECVDSTNVEPEMVLKLRVGTWPNSPHRDLQKYILCILNGFNIMSKEGVFKLDEARALIPREEYPEALERIDKCLYQRRHLPHEIAYYYMKCINAATPKEFHIF